MGVSSDSVYFEKKSKEAIRNQKDRKKKPPQNKTKTKTKNKKHVGVSSDIFESEIKKKERKKKHKKKHKQKNLGGVSSDSLYFESLDFPWNLSISLVFWGRGLLC